MDLLWIFYIIAVGINGQPNMALESLGLLITVANASIDRSGASKKETTTLDHPSPLPSFVWEKKENLVNIQPVEKTCIHNINNHLYVYIYIYICIHNICIYIYIIWMYKDLR